ncbi:MAG: HEAT repeat domain-containing protein, partial [Kiritimatiellia bacterium]
MEEEPQKGKIITALWQRRTVETLMRRLIDARTDAEANAILDEILTHGEHVIPVVLANLNTTDPHFRGALGLVAKHLPHDQIAPALWGALRDASLIDHARLTAALILERFLGEVVPPEALANLSDPTQVALQSLREVIGESRRSRAILIEYAEAFEEQPAEIQRLVLNTLEGILEGDDVVELLRMLAQSPSPAVSSRALDMLAQLRSPAAARALQMLLPTIHPSLQPAAQRALRKLQVIGIHITPLP